MVAVSDQEHTMTKLSDSQRGVLSAACQREDRNVLPLPASLRGGAAQKVIRSLLAKGLVDEVSAPSGTPVWREAEGGRLGLIVTDAAFHALGIPTESTAPEGPADTAPQPPHRARGGKKAATTAPRGKKAAVQARVAAERTSARKPHAETKQAQLVGMLKQPDGASIDEIVAATGWQPHSLRGAISGALKKKLGLHVISEKVEGRGRVYRVPS
jgi:hypothetical protein